MSAMEIVLIVSLFFNGVICAIAVFQHNLIEAMRAKKP